MKTYLITLILSIFLISCASNLDVSNDINPNAYEEKNTSSDVNKNAKGLVNSNNQVSIKKDTSSSEKLHTKSSESSETKSSSTDHSSAKKLHAKSSESSETETPFKIKLHLPFKPIHNPSGIMPMGETINHSPPMGHPGIDFQWHDKGAEIVIAADGIVGDLSTEISPYNEETIHTITVITKKYGITYEVVELELFHPNLQIGDQLTLGTVLGYPQIVASGTGRMIHWGFGRANPTGGRTNPEGIITNYFFNWLCPVPYFTKAELVRFEQIWENAYYNHKDQFPEICNGFFKLEK